MVSRIHSAEADPPEIRRWDNLSQKFCFPSKTLRERFEAGPNLVMSTKHRVQFC